MNKVIDRLYYVESSQKKYLPTAFFELYNIDVKGFTDTTVSNYYTKVHSAEKILSPFVDKMDTVTDTTGTHLSKSAILEICEMLHDVYFENWVFLYRGFYEEVYNPIENYSMVEVRTPNLMQTGHISSNSKVTQSQNGANKVNGFNSAQSVNATSDTSSVTTEAQQNDNFTHNMVSQTGTEKLTRSGNIGVTTSAQMLQGEIELRKWNLLNKICEDIDKIITLGVYEYD